MIRAFIAIPLPAEVKAVLAEVSHALADQVPDRSVRWVKPHLMHITLRFLGETAATSLPTLTDLLDNIASQHDAFKLRVDQVGCFPNKKRPRVIWIGLSGQLDTARALKQDIDNSLLSLGWEPEKRSFSPHLTLGRVKDSRRLRGVQWAADVEQVMVPVQTTQLIESELRSSGPIYTVRHTSTLRD